MLLKLAASTTSTRGSGSIRAVEKRGGMEGYLDEFGAATTIGLQTNVKQHFVEGEISTEEMADSRQVDCNSASATTAVFQCLFFGFKFDVAHDFLPIRFLYHPRSCRISLANCQQIDYITSIKNNKIILKEPYIL